MSPVERLSKVACAEVSLYCPYSAFDRAIAYHAVKLRANSPASWITWAVYPIIQTVSFLLATFGLKRLEERLWDRYVVEPQMGRLVQHHASFDTPKIREHFVNQLTTLAKCAQGEGNTSQEMNLYHNAIFAVHKIVCARFGHELLRDNKSQIKAQWQNDKLSFSNFPVALCTKFQSSTKFANANKRIKPTILDRYTTAINTLILSVQQNAVAPFSHENALLLRLIAI